MDVEGVFCMAKKNKSAGNGGRKVSAGIKLGVSLFVPLILVLGVIPLIVQMQLVPLAADGIHQRNMHLG